MRSALYQTNTHSWIFYMASLHKTTDADRHVAPLGHIILILSQPGCSFFLMLDTQLRSNSNFIVFGVTRSGLEPLIYCTRCELGNHYTTDAVPEEENLSFIVVTLYWTSTRFFCHLLQDGQYILGSFFIVRHMVLDTILLNSVLYLLKAIGAYHY